MSEKLEIIITASDQASSIVKKIGENLGGVLDKTLKLGLAGATAGFAAFTTGIGISLKEAMDAEVNIAKLNAVLKSTHGIAGVTAEKATALADSLSTMTRFSDDSILSAETMLLTFTNIGEKVFPQATEATLNMAEMFGGDATQAALQLGKALQDPVEGVGALRRVGVALTQQQEDQIKAMVEAGNVAGAQKVILKELEKEFGGVAKAAGATASGQLTIFKNKLLNIAESLGTTILPVVVRLGSAIADKLIPFFEQLSLVVGNFITGLATGDLSMVKETFGWLLGNQGWSNDIAFFIVDLAAGFKNLFDIFSEFGVSGVFTLDFWWQLNQIFGSEWGNRIREIAVAFGELYLKISDLVTRVIVPFIQEHSQIFINAFERIGAVFAGGLGIALITGLLGGLGAVIGALMSPIVLIIAGVTALSIAYDTNFLGMKDAVDSFVSWFKTTAMPKVISFITNDVIPALDKLYDWFVVDALPSIINFITKDFIPLTLDMWSAIKDIWDKVKGPLGDLLNWFTQDALPAVLDFIKTTVIPGMGDLWKEIQKLWDSVQPQLSKLSNWFRVDAIPAILNIVNNVVIPAFNALRTGISNIWDWGGPKLQSLYNFFRDNIGKVKISFIDPLITAIQSLIDWINSIHWPSPPSWLNTGSLTPGWAGFASGGAFKGMGIVGEAGRELVYAPGGAVVFPNDMLSRMGGTTNNYTQNVQMSGGSMSVIDEFQLMKAWGS